MSTNIDKAKLEQLCDELKIILRIEIDAGNSVVEAGSGWPNPESIMVMLGKPFIKDWESECRELIPADVQYVDINDPHYWKAELNCKKHNHILACRFK